MTHSRMYFGILYAFAIGYRFFKKCLQRILTEAGAKILETLQMSMKFGGKTHETYVTNIYVGRSVRKPIKLNDEQRRPVRMSNQLNELLRVGANIHGNQRIYAYDPQRSMNLYCGHAEHPRSFQRATLKLHDGVETLYVRT